MLELIDIRKSFNVGTPDETTLFSDFGFRVRKGGFVSVVGSNGSGKTTLLNIVCGSLMPDGGRIRFDGRDITRLPEYKRARFIGRVLQDPKAGTCPHLTVLENMALADNKQKSFGLMPVIDKKRIDRYRSLLERCEMGLENRLNTRVGALSGGQRQALALVISTMTDVQLLILDEHTAALDPKSSETVMALTDKLISETGITTVMVTHNLRHAVEYGDRLVMMHEGKIVLDSEGEDKRSTRVEDVLHLFNQISVECGN